MAVEPFPPPYILSKTSLSDIYIFESFPTAPAFPPPNTEPLILHFLIFKLVLLVTNA